jgi:hypothetical protein
MTLDPGVCNLILTQLDEIWMTTSFCSQNGRQLHFSKVEDDLNFFKIEDRGVWEGGGVSFKR